MNEATRDVQRLRKQPTAGQMPKAVKMPCGVWWQSWMLLLWWCGNRD